MILLYSTGNKIEAQQHTKRFFPILIHHINVEKAKILPLSIQKMTAKILSTFMDSHWILYQMKRRYNIIDCGYKGQEVIGDFPILVCSSQVELILKQYPEV